MERTERRTRVYTYRRDLEATELVPAIGVGVAVGIAAFYVATLLLQRTPLVSGSLAVKEPPDDDEDGLPPDPRGTRSRAALRRTRAPAHG